MSEPTYTPGPWRVEVEGPKTYVGSATGTIVLMPRAYDDESAANARLIAASPALYEALRVILEEPHGCPFCDSGRLRKPDDPAKGHTENCGFYLAQKALALADGSGQ